jgi:RNA polymerase sigma-70 factor (ECF subfamily)
MAEEGEARAGPSATSGSMPRDREPSTRDPQAGGTTAAHRASGHPAAVDPLLLHRLVVDHGDAVYRLALSIVRDPALAEDIAQDTLVKAWQALPTLRDGSSERSWVLRITHNTSISVLRTRRAVVVDPSELPERQTVPETSVESRVQSGAVLSDFIAALDELDDLSRSIIVLREVEGLSYQEIVEVLDVPLPTVKTRLLRARKKLGASLRGWT